MKFRRIRFGKMILASSNVGGVVGTTGTNFQPKLARILSDRSACWFKIPSRWKALLQSPGKTWSMVLKITCSVRVWVRDFGVFPTVGAGSSRRCCCAYQAGCSVHLPAAPPPRKALSPSRLRGESSSGAINADFLGSLILINKFFIIFS